ncbi:MAG: Tex family protein [Bacteroidales bacterium]
MSDKIIFAKLIAEELLLSQKGVHNVLELIDGGATVPFISRYRKEQTDGMEDVNVQRVNERYDTLQTLVKRKEYILQVIEQCGKLSGELKSKIDGCWDNTQLEDIYLPYKPKRKSRAETARGYGLEPLAKIIMSQHADDIEYKANRFVSEYVASVEDAINGAKDIIAEWVSENQYVRNVVRGEFRRSAVITSRVVKGKEEDGENYKNYFDLSEPLRRSNSHRLLAMRRGEKDGFLRVAIGIDDAVVLDKIKGALVKGRNESSMLVEQAVVDSYKRLIKGSIETEFANLSSARADDEAIEVFSQNLRQLLFAPPLGSKRIMGVDPGFRSGCKVVCLDEQGNLLHNDVIYPNPPQNDSKIAAKKVSYLVEAYAIDAIALGNGTASRETERFLQSLRYNRDIKIFVVSENGASIYSASKIARDEFPDKDVTVRGAVSIGRRLLDPLAELVKIDPKSIGVGQYQHDVDQKKLKESLKFTVESCVNRVGVNVNTASKELLTYVAGLSDTLAQNIVNYRAENGDFKSRRDILKVPRMGDKAFQQSGGFLRIPQGDSLLDNSAVHPESYAIVAKMAKDSGCSVAELISSAEKRAKIKLDNYVTDSVGLPTLEDIMNELDKPGRDPRKGVKVLEFDDKVRTIDDLTVGQVLNGIVNNLTQFGAFVDFGIKENGLVHISEMADRFISKPSEVVTLHQHVKVRVIEIDKSRKRIALSMKGI